MRNQSKNFLTCCLVFATLSCENSQERHLREGLKNYHSGQLRDALAEFDSAMKRAPGTTAALRAARESVKILVFDLKNYERAISALRFLILYSTDAEERWRAQSQIAQIYFDNLAWYDKALIEYSKLLSSNVAKTEKIRIKLAIARCYYYLGQLPHSWSEASLILAEDDLPEGIAFDSLLLQANIQISDKKYSEAVKSLELLAKRYPERAKKENVGLNLSLCHEELGNQDAAIQALEEIKGTYESKDYIELRIKKIRERFSDLPRKRPKE